MEGFCRSCLVKFDEPTDLMPYSEKNRRLFVYATGLQAKRNDTFIFQLCKDCCLNMKVACNFKKTCRNSDKKFKNYLGNKEAGENVDFCTFLKNSDESLKFRLPMYVGNSTPAYRNKDDDNDSTCTSIQNFMTDILKAEEIPDSEARIIREVIEEEADIMEDSLDSHWLQDDVSINTDFRLDFSFSPFSTPRSTNSDRCYTPQKLNEPTAMYKGNSMDVKLEPPDDNINSDAISNNKKIKHEASDDKCVIDMNLEKALKNDSAKKFMLDELLATPPVIPDVSAPSTPLITNILFGDKMDFDTENRPKNVYAPTKTIKETEIDALYDFFETGDNVNEIKQEHIHEYNDLYQTGDINSKKNIVNDRKRLKKYDKTDSKENNDSNKNNDANVRNESYEKSTLSTKSNGIANEPSSPDEDKYCLEKFYCKICDRQFKHVMALKIHCMRLHKIKFKTVKRVRQKMICDYCGKVFTSSKCIVRHIQNHMNPDQYHCDHCPLSFRTETGLKAHRSTHGIVCKSDSKKRKKYVCNICGSVQSSSSNHHVHLRRHSNKYTTSCTVCGKGFYRTSDLETHMRCHTGERPFVCMYCPSKFARQDALNRHIKCHTGEKPFQCTFCDDKFISAAVLRQHRLKCKTCLGHQMSVTKTTLNSIGGVTVYYAEVANSEEISKNGPITIA